jgi:hypothetical protein
MESNFYDLFEIENTSVINDIVSAYKNKINPFNEMEELSDEDISKIKLYKIGLYILITPNLRTIYDNKIKYIASKNSEIQEKSVVNEPEEKQSFSPATLLGKSKAFPNNEPKALNEGDNNNLDSLFNIDNSWMTKSESSNNVNKKKSLVEGNEIGNRIFSIKNITKQTDTFSEFANNLRKPLQGREEKKDKTENK